MAENSLFKASGQIDHCNMSGLTECYNAVMSALNNNNQTINTKDDLEGTITDFLSEKMKLPMMFTSKHYKNNPGNGHGVIKDSSEEAVLMCLKTAINLKFSKLYNKDPRTPRLHNSKRLVCYSSEQTALLGERCAMLAGLVHRTLQTNENGILEVDTLLGAIAEDKSNNLIPIFLMASFGSANMGVFDDLNALGPICEINNIWIHADCSAGAGVFMNDSNSYVTEGLRFASSMHIDMEYLGLHLKHCVINWFRFDSAVTKDCMEENNLNLLMADDADQNNQLRQFMKQTKLMQLFVAVTVAEELYTSVNRMNILTARLYDLMNYDKRFRIFGIARVSMLCFRLDKSNAVNHMYFDTLHKTKSLNVSPVYHYGKLWLRFDVTGCHDLSTQMIDSKWDLLKTVASLVLKKVKQNDPNPSVPCNDRNNNYAEIEDFVDQLDIFSFFDDNEETLSFYQHLNPIQKWSPACIKGMSQFDEAYLKSSAKETSMAPSVEGVPTANNDSGCDIKTKQEDQEDIRHVIRNLIGTEIFTGYPMGQFDEEEDCNGQDEASYSPQQDNLMGRNEKDTLLIKTMSISKEIENFFESCKKTDKSMEEDKDAEKDELLIKTMSIGPEIENFFQSCNKGTEKGLLGHRNQNSIEHENVDSDDEEGMFGSKAHEEEVRGESFTVITKTESNFLLPERDSMVGCGKKNTKPRDPE